MIARTGTRARILRDLDIVEMSLRSAESVGLDRGAMPAHLHARAMTRLLRLRADVARTRERGRE